MDIEVTDPRGFVIRCTREYWETHVLVSHPDLKGCEKVVERALQSPTHGHVYTSNSRPDRHVYYGELRRRVEIKVVVEFNAKNEGRIVSATACSRRPNGEKLLWHKQ